MSAGPWTANNGGLLIDSNGRLRVCANCPCPPLLSHRLKNCSDPTIVKWAEGDLFSRQFPVGDPDFVRIDGRCYAFESLPLPDGTSHDFTVAGTAPPPHFMHCNTCRVAPFIEITVAGVDASRCGVCQVQTGVASMRVGSTSFDGTYKIPIDPFFSPTPAPDTTDQIATYVSVDPIALPVSGSVGRHGEGECDTAFNTDAGGIFTEIVYPAVGEDPYLAGITLGATVAVPQSGGLPSFNLNTRSFVSQDSSAATAGEGVGIPNLLSVAGCPAEFGMFGWILASGGTVSFQLVYE